MSRKKPSTIEQIMDAVFDTSPSDELKVTIVPTRFGPISMYSDGRTPTTMSGKPASKQAIEEAKKYLRNMQKP
jgi:hypothetical protein